MVYLWGSVAQSLVVVYHSTFQCSKSPLEPWHNVRGDLEHWNVEWSSRSLPFPSLQSENLGSNMGLKLSGRKLWWRRAPCLLLTPPCVDKWTHVNQYPNENIYGKTWLLKYPLLCLVLAPPTHSVTLYIMSFRGLTLMPQQQL